MKGLVLMWLGLSVVASTAVAQGVSPAVHAGSKSLNFTFGGFGGFGLAGTGPAGGIGVSYFLSPDAAVRVGLQIRSFKRTLSFNSATGATGVDGVEQGFTAGASVDYLLYLRAATARVRPYVGGGLGVTNTSNKARPAAATGVVVAETRNAPGGITGGAFASPGRAYDLHANIGAEFFLFNEISVAGEYGLNVISRTSPANQEVVAGATPVVTKGNPVTNVLGFGSLGATVRIYF